MSYEQQSWSKVLLKTLWEVRYEVVYIATVAGTVIVLLGF